MNVNITSSVKTEWLIIFLILDTTELDVNLEMFFKNLENTKLKKTTKIYLLKDTIQRIRHPNEFIDFNLEVSEFVYNKEIRKTRLNRITLSDVDITDGFAWLKAIQQIYSISNSRFSSLVTWSHGSGLGIGNTLRPIIVKELEFNLIRNSNTRNTSLEIMKSESNDATIFRNALQYKRNPKDPDCLNIEQLFISEIGKGLEEITRNNKFDIVIMCNCNSQLIDNCYNLSGITNFYFAPMAGIQLQGFDFPNFINYINGTTKIRTLKKLRDFVLRTALYMTQKNDRSSLYKMYFRSLFKELFEGYKRLAPNDHIAEAIVVCDLRRMPEILTLFNPICSYFRTHKEKVFPLIKDVMEKKIKGFPGPHLFDAVTFFNVIKKEINSEEFDILAESFEKFVLKNVFVDKMIGVNLLNEKPKMGLKCFTVWMPKGKRSGIPRAFACQDLMHFLNPPFVEFSEWDDFVRDFITWQNNKINFSNDE